MVTDELLSEITDHVRDIHRLLLLFESHSVNQFDAIDQAQEAITSLEIDQLHELREAFGK